MKKVLLSLLAACVFSVSTTGCFGSYSLTKNVKKAADGIGNPIVKELVYFVLGMPVGILCVFGDWLIFNTLEYWTGSNPVAYHETDENGNSVTAVKMEDGSLYMRLDAASGESQELVLQRDEEVIRILDTKGTVLKEAAYAE